MNIFLQLELAGNPHQFIEWKILECGTSGMYLNKPACTTTPHTTIPVYLYLTFVQRPRITFSYVTGIYYNTDIATLFKFQHDNITSIIVVSVGLGLSSYQREELYCPMKSHMILVPASRSLSKGNWWP